MLEYASCISLIGISDGLVLILRLVLSTSRLSFLTVLTVINPVFLVCLSWSLSKLFREKKSHILDPQSRFKRNRSSVPKPSTKKSAENACLPGANAKRKVDAAKEAAWAGKGAFPGWTRRLNLIAALGFADAAPGWCYGSSLLGLSAAKCQGSLTVVRAGSLSPFFSLLLFSFPSFSCFLLVFFLMFRHTCSFYTSSKGTAATALLELQTLQGNNGFQTIPFPMQ